MLVIFRVILGGNFSFYFNLWLENKTENPTLNKNSVVLMIEIKVFFFTVVINGGLETGNSKDSHFDKII